MNKLSDHVLTKNRMMFKRGGVVYARCDHCGKRLNGYSEKDELLHRSASAKGSESQEIILSEYLSALVCPKCHYAHHHGGIPLKEYRDTCFYRLFKVYGRPAVEAEFNRLKEALRYSLGYELPKEK